MIRAYRATIKAGCIVDVRNRLYPATIENISSDGALLTIESAKLPKLKANQICNVMLGNALDSCSPRNTCMIVRLDSDNARRIAVRFLEPLDDTTEPPPYKHQVRMMTISENSKRFAENSSPG